MRAPTTSGLPATVASDRTAVLRRTLTKLPNFLLVQLANGLEHYGDRLVSGRLYGSTDGGGCPVGVLMLERNPAIKGRGRLSFWLRHRWRRSCAGYRELAPHSNRLTHLQEVFDHAVRLTRARNPDLAAQDAAAMVGHWFWAETRREVERRRAALGLTSQAFVDGALDDPAQAGTDNPCERKVGWSPQSVGDAQPHGVVQASLARL